MGGQWQQSGDLPTDVRSEIRQKYRFLRSDELRRGRTRLSVVFQRDEVCFSLKACGEFWLRLKNGDSKCGKGNVPIMNESAYAQLVVEGFLDIGTEGIDETQHVRGWATHMLIR